MRKFIVIYRYLATGMEGRADENSYGIVESDDPLDAVEQIVNRQYPELNEKRAERDFFRGCLTALELK